jgi:hypothetical protein
MKQSKEYIFKSRNLLYETIFTGVVLVLSLFLLLSLFRLVSLHKFPVVLLVNSVFFVWASLMFYCKLYTLKITRQFIKYDEGKKVVIDSARTSLTLTQGDKTRTINSDQVQRVEVYEQKYLGNFGRYNYIVIYTVDGERLLITNFTIPLLTYDRILEVFLRKKPRTYFKTRFNFIDEDKFKSTI